MKNKRIKKWEKSHINFCLPLVTIEVDQSIKGHHNQRKMDIGHVNSKYKIKDTWSVRRI